MYARYNLCEADTDITSVMDKVMKMVLAPDPYTIIIKYLRDEMAKRGFNEENGYEWESN